MSTMAGVLQLDLSSTFGVVFWGFVVAITYTYFICNNDTLSLRVFVVTMMIMDFSTTALAAQSVNYYLIVNYGNPTALSYMTKPFLAEFFITSVVTLGSQMFYASRIFLVTRYSKLCWVSAIIGLLAVVSFASAISQLHELIVIGREIAKLHEETVQIPIALANGFAAACDITSTISLLAFLTSHGASHKEIRPLLLSVVFFAVGRGFLVAVAQVGLLATFFGSSSSKLYWVPFHLNLSKLHVNTMLAMLNSRSSVRSKHRTEQLQSVSANSCRFRRSIGSSKLPISKQWLSACDVSAEAFKAGEYSFDKDESAISSAKYDGLGQPESAQGIETAINLALEREEVA